jgi:hypothetical protein
MITENQYLEAKAIVEAYEMQQRLEYENRIELDDEYWHEPEPCPTCGDIDGMVNPCCAGYDPLHYLNCGYG